MPNLQDKFNDWLNKNKNNHLQLGSIVTSILNFEQFSELNEDPNPNQFNPGNKAGKPKSKWAPLDGRNITGSKLAQYTTPEAALPDCRGMFLRGLNSFDGLYTTPIPADREVQPDNRLAGQYQKDEFKRHNHGSDAISTMGSGFEEGHGNPNYGGAGAVISFEGTAAETRPKNIAVYYYIRIN